MKLKYINDESLQILKNNQKSILNSISKNPTKDWIKDYLGVDCFPTSKITVNDFTLFTDEAKPLNTDIKNIKIIFDTFKNLNETQAADERLWVGLALNDCYDYMIYRWGIDSESKMKYRWVFHTRGKRGMFYHGIARLWWYGHVSYDSSRDNPYELTEFGMQNIEILEGLIFRNYSNSREISLAILSALKDFHSDGGILTRDVLRPLYIYVSLLGGVSILDAFSKEELHDLVYKKLFTL